MGTRSITKLCRNEGNEIVTLYRQSDGYPEGHGQELARWLSRVMLTNGLNPDRENAARAHQKILCNGMPCLAAQLVKHAKDAPGLFYLYPAGSNDHGQDFTYSVYSDGGPVAERGDRVRMTCKPTYDDYPSFDGYPEDFKAWVDGPWAEFMESA